MVQDDPSAPAVFHIDVGDGDDVRISNLKNWSQSTLSNVL